MIYVCIPVRDEAPTIGLVLWKIRKVFSELGREYQILVTDDGSRDATPEVLTPYLNVLPLTVHTHPEPLGYAATVESLLRMALDRTDRPRRDAAVLVHADFAHGPEFLPEIIRRLDSGADLVVGEGQLSGQPVRGIRWLRRWAPMLVPSAIRVAGVRDIVSGFMATRLSCLRLALDRQPAALLTTEGWAANAELIGRLGAEARRVETVSVVERHDLRQRPSRIDPWGTARALWAARPALSAAATPR
ncbi:MAG: glycosyltransferase [Gemmatimonadota bacterium]